MQHHKRDRGLRVLLTGSTREPDKRQVAEGLLFPCHALHRLTVTRGGGEIPQPTTYIARLPQTTALWFRLGVT
jgi:hypothetical protein